MLKNQSSIIIGLTGGVGSGKSTVSQVWENLGARVIDADQVAREVIVPNSEGYAALLKAFSQAFKNGELNRQLLRELIFNDPQKRQQLDAIMHPLIYNRIVKLINDNVGEEQFDYPNSVGADIGRPKPIIIEAPLLFEAGFHTLTPTTVCAVCSLPTRIARITMRDNITPDLALQMIQSQLDNDQKAALCDYTIDTDVPLAQLEKMAMNLYDTMIRGTSQPN